MRKDKLKGFLAGILLSTLIFGFAIPAMAATVRQLKASYNGIKITLDGKAIVPKDSAGKVVEPFVVDGTTYLPVRAVADAVGLGVTWDGESQTVILRSKEPTLPAAPFTLSTGQYIVGEDIPAGKYDCRAVAGSGNFQGTVKSIGNLNEILSVKTEYYTNNETYSNLRLADGDTVIIKGDLSVEFTSK